MEITDVYEEVSELFSKHRITKYASKKVSRKYAFELHDVPAESDYLKVLYDYERKHLQQSLFTIISSYIFILLRAFTDRY